MRAPSRARPTSTTPPRSPTSSSSKSIEEWGGFHAKLLKKPILWQDGYVIPPTEPGLGIELNEEVCEAHPYTGTNLHLEMTNRPLRKEE